MKHQLVLQFVGDDEETVEKVIGLEDRLIDTLEGSTAVEVDGHETGEGTTNLVLIAKNAAKAWERLEPVIEEAASENLELNAVAYRDLDADEYTVLWPLDFEGEFAMS